MNKNIIWNGITFKTDFHLYERLVKGITDETACRNPISYESFSELITKHMRPGGRIDKDFAQTVILGKEDLLKLYKKQRIKIVKPMRTCDYFTFVCRFYNGYKDFSTICLLEKSEQNTIFETYFKNKETLEKESKKNEVQEIGERKSYSTKCIKCSKTGRKFNNIEHAYRVNAIECKNPCGSLLFRKRINGGETDLTKAIQKSIEERGGFLAKSITCSKTGRVFRSIEEAYNKNKEEIQNPCSPATFRKRIRMGGTDLTNAIKNDYYQEMLKYRYIPNKAKEEQKEIGQENKEEEIKINNTVAGTGEINEEISNFKQKITCSKTGRTFDSVIHAYKVNMSECNNPCSESVFRDKIKRGARDFSHAIKNWGIDTAITCSNTGIKYNSILDAYRKLSVKHKQCCSSYTFRKRIQYQGITDLTEAIQLVMPNGDVGRKRIKLDAVETIYPVIDKQKQSIFYQFLRDIKNSFSLFIARYIQQKNQRKKEKLIKELEKLK